MTYHFSGADDAAVPVGFPVKGLTPQTARMLTWNGFYVGGHLGYGEARFDGTYNGFGVDNKSAGLLGGMHVGQNWQTNTFVYGWEADLSAAGGRWEKSTIGYPAGDDNGVLTSVALLASLRGRLGIAFDRTLLYVTGGLAYTQARGIGHSSTLFHSQTVLNFNSFGGVVGLGAEWKQRQNFSWRLEGLYYMFNQSRTGLTSGGAVVNLRLKDVLTVRLGATIHF